MMVIFTSLFVVTDMAGISTYIIIEFETLIKGIQNDKMIGIFYFKYCPLKCNHKFLQANIVRHCKTNLSHTLYFLLYRIIKQTKHGLSHFIVCLKDLTNISFLFSNVSVL